MHSRKWKEFEKTRVFQKIKLFAKRITGKEPWLKVDTIVNLKPCADWTICQDLVSRGGVVYSLGVGEDIEFDLIMIKEHDARVYAFDPTPGTLEWLAQKKISALFHFQPWAVAGRDRELVLYPRVKRDGTFSTKMFTLIAENESVKKYAVRVPAFTLKSIMKKLSHTSIDILKMDIEGAEYEVIESMLKAAIYPVQILVEFHSRFSGIGKDKTLASVRQLKRAGYSIADISVTGREVLFSRFNDLSDM